MTTQETKKDKTRADLEQDALTLAKADKKLTADIDELTTKRT